MMIQWAAQDYDSLNWFIILRVSFDTSNFVRDLKLTFFTILNVYPPPKLNYVTDVVFTSSRSALPFRVFNTLDHQCWSRFNGYK